MEVQERGDICAHIADSFGYIAETNATLESNYLPKNKKDNGSGPNVRNASKKSRLFLPGNP